MGVDIHPIPSQLDWIWSLLLKRRWHGRLGFPMYSMHWLFGACIYSPHGWLTWVLRCHSQLTKVSGLGLTSGEDSPANWADPGLVCAIQISSSFQAITSKRKGEKESFHQKTKSIRKMLQYQRYSHGSWLEKWTSQSVCAPLSTWSLRRQPSTAWNRWRHRGWAAATHRKRNPGTLVQNTIGFGSSDVQELVNASPPRCAPASQQRPQHDLWSKKLLHGIHPYLISPFLIFLSVKKCHPYMDSF